MERSINLQYIKLWEFVQKWKTLRWKRKYVVQDVCGTRCHEKTVNDEFSARYGHHYGGLLPNTNALCGYPLLKLEIRDSCQISTTAAIFFLYDYFRQTIWRLASIQFYFWYIFWDQLNTANSRWMIHNVISFNPSRVQGGCK